MADNGAEFGEQSGSMVLASESIEVERSPKLGPELR